MFRLPAEVKPGEFADISVPFTAPALPGNYGSYWKLYNSSGFVFGDAFSISISVGDPTPTGKAPTATFTPTPTTTLAAGISATPTVIWGTQTPASP